ncbi:GGDEF domain-containing protein [Acinetobacter sp. B51(2017)]|uniref:GGDEF domain-containing protein n=1 Tax=Acinetobacter sp. B51(2017) TaxID=2060938 RepID=UPI000F079AB5|nr:GGDEF domain-containing protein [Acinetobacter sp. B51(2017)]
MKLPGSTQFTYHQIQKLIQHGLNLVHFPWHIEALYRRHYCREAAREFRYRAPIILALYGFLTFGIYKISLGHEVGITWMYYYTWVGIIIFIAWVLSFIKKLSHWFDIYVGIGSMMAVALTFLMITVIGPVQSNALFHVAMMYAVVIIYGFVGLRFYTAFIAGWSGGLLAMLVSLLLDYNIDWVLFNRTYTFSSFLGMALAYAIDRQHRENYLQNCIIELNQKKLSQQAELLESLSRQDALTDLANRRYLEEVLTREWFNALRYQQSLTVMMIDIDYFKHYNDSFGHVAGDNCLKAIATVLKQITSRGNELAARYGGEEFMLIFPMTDAQQAQKVADKLLQCVNDLALPHPNSLISDNITVSIGVISTIPQRHHQLSDLIMQADQALYQAKKYGRNQYALLRL